MNYKVKVIKKAAFYFYKMRRVLFEIAISKLLQIETAWKSEPLVE